MEIIDAQVGKPQLPVPWEYGAASEPALCAELLREAMDCVGVDAALIQGSLDFCSAAAARYPDRLKGALLLSSAIVRSDTIEEVVRDLRQKPGMLALRAVVRSYVDGKLIEDYRSGAYDKVFAYAAKHGVPVFIQAAGYLDTLKPILRKHPGLTLILDHCGLDQQPSEVGPDPWAGLPAVLELAQFQNVAIKLSGIVTLSKAPYPHLDIWPPFHKFVQAYGPDRIMWGSDFTRLRFAPRTTKRGDRADWYGLYSDSVNFLRHSTEFSQSEKERMFGGTIRRILGWPKSTPATA